MESQRIAGRYHVLHAIGRGGMGTVWLCRDEVLGREVAVKQIGGLPGEPEVETARAMREARSAAALNHPNVVSVYDVVHHDDRPWLVMEYVEGQTLAEILAERGRLSPEVVAEMGARLAGALARAHERGIVHRDVKPGNVLVDRSGRPKISDFGIARALGDDQLTQTGFMAGTPGYLSPELARGGDPTPASDVWALGATLYTAVEGQPPYEPRSNPLALLREIATEPPRPMEHAGALEPAIAAMMQQDPARRWDMVTAAKRLGRAARGETAPVDGAPGTAAPTQVLAALPPLEATRPMPVPPAEERTVARQPEPTPPLPTPVAGGAVGGGSVGGGAVGGRAPDAVGDASPPAMPGQPGRRRGRWLAPVLVLLLVVLGGAYLLSRMSHNGAATATGTPPRAKATSHAPSTPTSRTRATPSTSAAPSSSPASSAPSSTPSSTPSSAPAAAPGGDKALASFVKSYFTDVTQNRDRTWAELTPAMQSAAGGRSGYDGFWASISSVKVTHTHADAAGKVAVTTLTYTRDNGSTATEQHRLTFVTKDGSYLIDSDHRVG